jgi:hypothetical protein
VTDGDVGALDVSEPTPFLLTTTMAYKKPVLVVSLNVMFDCRKGESSGPIEWLVADDPF